MLPGCCVPDRRGALPSRPLPASFASSGQLGTGGVDLNRDAEEVPDVSDEDADTEDNDDAEDGLSEPDDESSAGGSFRRMLKRVSFFQASQKVPGPPQRQPPTVADVDSLPNVLRDDTKTRAGSQDQDIEDSDEKLPAPNGEIDPDAPAPDEPLLSREEMIGGGDGVALVPPYCINGGVGANGLPGRYTFFDDPYLFDLIELALVGNQELRILNEEINIAAAEVQERRGAILPIATLGASAEIDKASRFTRDGAVEDQLLVAPGRGFPEPLPNFLVAANLSWEIDIWRRLRNARDASIYRYLGTRDGRNYFVTRLVAEVAENYYELLALDNRLANLDQTIAIQQQSLQTAKALKAAARGTQLGVLRFEAEVRQNQSEKLIIQQEIVETENRINSLLGRYPQPIQRDSSAYLDRNLLALGAGVPAELLRNRSDVREAERVLTAAGLDLRVARAAFYPGLVLSTSVGYEAFNTRFLFDSPESLIYNAAGEIVGPLINRRAIQAEFNTANAEQLQALYDYQQTLLDAFTEVINQFSRVQKYGDSLSVKILQLRALEESVETANALFQNVRAEYIEVLLAQRDLMEARMTVIETKQEQLTAMVYAYQALGGGRF